MGEEGFQLIQREDGGGIGGGFFGVGVDFDEEAIDAGGDGSAGEEGDELALAGGGVTESAGELGGVRGVHEDGCVEGVLRLEG